MPVAWAAEDALSRACGAVLFAPNLERRSYWLERNRAARLVRRIIPAVSRCVYSGMGTNVFLFLMGFHRDILPVLNDPKRQKCIYLFDSWEPEWTEIESLLRAAKNISKVYFSSSQTADHFRGRLPFPIEWLPQAFDRQEAASDCQDPRQKKKVVLNIGRSNTQLDEFFHEFCRQHGFQYIVPGKIGGVTCDTRAEYLSLLHSSAIVLVHPRNLQYPETTGCVSLLTARYFEAFSSGSVVCGFKPTSGEFERVLCDFPFVEYSASFESDLLAAVQQPQVWADARRRCLKDHTWDARLAPVANELRKGFRNQ